MTYFTDSVYEKMMVQKPRYGREKTSPALNDKRCKKKNGQAANVEPVSNSKESKVKE